MERKKILWLVSWYPNRLMPYNGDFIKRHAQAVSMYEDVQVIYVVRDLNGDLTKEVFIEESVKEGLKEKLIYYYIPSTGLSIINKYSSEKKYRQYFKDAVTDYIEKSGIPSLVHVHVGMKTGTIACWMKKKYSVPYIISEHWSGFLQEASEKINEQPFYIKLLWKKVIAGASGFSAVSNYLAGAIKKYFPVHQIKVIPNVVDTSIFYPYLTYQTAPRFIHISGLSELKNPTDIFKALAIVKKKYPFAILQVVGPLPKQLKELTFALQLENSIKFYEEIPQQQLSELIRQSIALILYSSYETFGCVIIEANACGVPVIVSDIPVFHETVEEGINGFFVKRNDPEALAERMIAMIKNQSLFNSDAIAKKTASLYSYETVGKQFSSWYAEILSKG